MCTVLATCFLCLAAFSSQIETLLIGEIKPEISFSCEDTQENQEAIIDEVAKLYGCFLTPQIHEKKTCRKLRSQGMWLEIKTAEDYFPEDKDRDTFVENLRLAMKADFAKDNPWGIRYTKLGMDYGPEPGALNEAFYNTKLDVRCNSLFPYKSLTYIEIKEDQIWVRIWLKGPVN